MRLSGLLSSFLGGGFVRFVLDNDSLKELAMPFLKERDRLPFVSSVFQFLLDELKPGVVLIENFAPRFDANREVGIDVAKAQLEVFIRPGGESFSVANDEVGIGALRRQLKPADFVILEATGGLEMPVASALAAAAIAVAIVNPRQVRDFARATGRLAKTDRA
jgi:Transposase